MNWAENCFAFGKSFNLHLIVCHRPSLVTICLIQPQITPATPPTPIEMVVSLGFSGFLSPWEKCSVVPSHWVQINTLAKYEAKLRSDLVAAPSAVALAAVFLLSWVKGRGVGVGGVCWRTETNEQPTKFSLFTGVCWFLPSAQGLICREICWWKRRRVWEAIQLKFDR